MSDQSNAFESRLKTIVKRLGKWASVVAGVLTAIILLAFTLNVLLKAIAYHWALGLAVGVALAVGAYVGVRDLRHGLVETGQGVRIIAGILLMTIASFSVLSFVLNRFGYAHYQGFQTLSTNDAWSTTFNFISFYTWQLFDLIPGLEINEALGWNTPLVKSGMMSGVLLVAFRAIIIFVLLKEFRNWWIRRSGRAKLDEHKSLIRRWFNEVWNKGRADAIGEMLAEDGIVHGLADPAGQPVSGIGDFKAFHSTFREAFPNIVVNVEDAIAEGDKVAARCSVQGRHAGDSLGLKASQAVVDFTGMVILRVKDGKIVEAWNNFDFMKMYRQMGVIP